MRPSCTTPTPPLPNPRPAPPPRRSGCLALTAGPPANRPAVRLATAPAPSGDVRSPNRRGRRGGDEPGPSRDRAALPAVAATPQHWRLPDGAVAAAHRRRGRIPPRWCRLVRRPRHPCPVWTVLVWRAAVRLGVH